MKGKILFLVLAVVTIAAMAFLGTGTANAGISATVHNLSFTGTGPIHAASGEQNSEICQWCHTPHHANTGFTGAPLWNKGVPAGPFNMYGTTVAGDTPGALDSISKACLSCHDGVDAINSLVYDVDNETVNPAGANVMFNGATTAVTMPGVFNLGTDLSTNHPVSIVYNDSAASLYPNATTAFGTKFIKDILDQTGEVTCATCHDPHVAINDMTAQGTTAGDYFLRKGNTGSALCLTCHNK